jgi:ABC-type dipeptide/oligopeptide/nickel transport system permease subunit
MLRNGADQFIESAFWVPFYPGMAITITVLSCCFFGDSLRDALDPRLRRE